MQILKVLGKVQVNEYPGYLLVPGIGYNIKNKKYVEKMLVMLLCSRILNGVPQKCVYLKIKRDF